MMPAVAMIDGIKMEIFYGDHPPPHLHASSAEYELLVCIDDGTVYEDHLPRKLQRRVLDYVNDPKDREELKTLWQKFSKVS